MTALLKSRILSIAIDRKPKRVYAFVSNLANLPKWATTFCRSVRHSKGTWIAETPQGPVEIRLAKKNGFGIVDHSVQPSAGAAVFVPMRVIPNGRGSEVIFTLFRLPEMSDARYAEDIRWVKQDLNTLKRVMEADLPQHVTSNPTNRFAGLHE